MATLPLGRFSHTLQFPMQYRTLERVYVIYERDFGITLKIADIAQKHFTELSIPLNRSNREVLGEERNALLRGFVAKRKPRAILQVFLQCGLLSKELFLDIVREGPMEQIDEQAFHVVVDEMTPENRKKATTLFEGGHSDSLYMALTDLISPDKERERIWILLKGVLHALEEGNVSSANTLLRRAKGLFSNVPLTLLDAQVVLEARGLLKKGREEELQGELQSLIPLYKKAKDLQDAYKALGEIDRAASLQKDIERAVKEVLKVREVLSSALAVCRGDKVAPFGGFIF